MIAGLFFSTVMIWVGVLLLIMTPFVRVVTIVVVFFARREMIFAVIASYVILMLVISSILRL